LLVSGSLLLVAGHPASPFGLRRAGWILAAGFPFDCAQGGESFDFAQDREPVERPVEPPPARE